VAVPEKDLPVALPYDVEFRPNGQSPLAMHEGFMNCTCPKCGGSARRDPDTLDTFVCSSWYFLRYPDNRNNDEPFNTKKINQILPVDKYIGGKEHACGHLLYSRFITRALYDMGYVNFKEPFTSLVHQGSILGPDGYRMSKTRGNTITPDKFVDVSGADCFRLYLLFGFNFMQGGPWSDEGVNGCIKFVERVARLIKKISEEKLENEGHYHLNEKELDYAVNFAIKNVANDLEIFSFNTAVARIMELVNAMYKYDNLEHKNTVFLKDIAKKLVVIISPMLPHLAEEFNLWLGDSESVFKKRFPTVDESKLIKDEIEIVIQINNKIKAHANIPLNADEQTVLNLVKEIDVVKQVFETQQVKKQIFIKNKLLNLIV
jgi:leucyl-tRNA synthetase